MKVFCDSRCMPTGSIVCGRGPHRDRRDGCSTSFGSQPGVPHDSGNRNHKRKRAVANCSSLAWVRCEQSIETSSAI